MGLVRTRPCNTRSSIGCFNGSTVKRGAKHGMDGPSSVCINCSSGSGCGQAGPNSADVRSSSKHKLGTFRVRKIH